MKKIIVFVSLLALIGQALAEPAKGSATMRLTFGWLRGANGVRQSVQGVDLKIDQVIKLDPSQVKRMRPIKGKRDVRIPRPRPPFKSRNAPIDLVSLAEALVGKNLYASTAPAGGGMFEQVVYSSRTGNYYILDAEFSDPSTLDDVVMSGGAGKLWNAIWIGLDISDAHDFLIRWQIFDNTNSNQNHNESAFQNILGPNNILGEPAGDFGGIENPQDWPGYTGPGSYLVRFELPTPSILWPGINCPDNTIYMGQQFREPQPDGEGPFDLTYKTVYTADIPVAIGSSQDGFWYDFDDLNGIYSADEFELLGNIDGQAQPFNNVCREIVTSGSSAEFGPFFAQLVFGILVSGNTPELQDSDDQYMIFKPSWVGARTDPNAQVLVEAQSPNANPTGFRFSTEVGASSGGATMKIELYNFTTSAYDLYDTRAVAAADTNVEVTVTSSFSRYVRASDRRVRSRISFFASGVDRNFSLRMDRAHWIVTYP